MTREEVYKKQMQDIGIYHPAFDPAISALSQLERELTRAKKEWSATVPKGCAPSVLDPHYAIIQQLRRDIMSYRDALGLTPKALQRLRSKQEVANVEQDDISVAFERLLSRVESYESAT